MNPLISNLFTWAEERTRNDHHNTNYHAKIDVGENMKRMQLNNGKDTAP
jgi:hypothetical protein